MTTTKHEIEEQIPWANEIVAMAALEQAAVARGVDPGLASYLAQSAAVQKHVMQHNARAMGREPLHYGSFEEFVLIHGQPMRPPQGRPRPKGLRKGTDKMCFRNATHAAIAHDEDGWRYVEGFGTSFIPTHHAWVLDADDNLIETTWRTAGESYVGVEFPHDIWRAAIALTGTYGIFGQTLLEAPYDPAHPEAFIERLRAKHRKARR